MKALEGTFLEGHEKESDPMFSQSHEDFMCLLPEKIEDKNIDFLPSLEFDSLFDCWEKNFAPEFKNSSFE